MSIVLSCLDLLILAHLIKDSKEKYYYILIDSTSSLSLLTFNTLITSNQLIIPVQAQYFSIRGMAKLMQVVNKVQQCLNSDLKIAEVLIKERTFTKAYQSWYRKSFREKSSVYTYETPLRLPKHRHRDKIFFTMLQNQPEQKIMRMYAMN